MTFKLQSSFLPAGDQPSAIKELSDGIKKRKYNQVLLGVTGSGKTFTIAHVIQKINKPTLILAHNKTLAAQLYGEMKNFFPNNHVEYFVSYYDYYQPEAYIPKNDTYIAKEATINKQIDQMRHSATRALIENKDVIIVASVSCIYGIGPIEMYKKMVLNIKKKLIIKQEDLLNNFVELQYKRNNLSLERGTFRTIGDSIEIFPAHFEDRAWKILFFDDEIEQIFEIDPLTGKKLCQLNSIKIYPNNHYVTSRTTLKQALKLIKIDLKKQIEKLNKNKSFLEAKRLEERVLFDIEMIETTGFCSGIENYSRYLSGRKPGEPPPTLFEYLPNNSLLFIDESHVTIPQLKAMYKGDLSRKTNLVNHGFRLPACLDNRPLKFEEWNKFKPQTIFISATPGTWELELTKNNYTEQVIRPTGLMDPICIIKPTNNQIDDLITECVKLSKNKEKILVTTLTKKLAEDLSEYLNEVGLKVCYMHSDIDTLKRIEIIQDLRAGKFDVLVGVNLLREGLDIPECSLVAILDADKEGFLRSKTSLIQTIGRVARNVNGKAILYADLITKSIKAALNETKRRRKKQKIYNKKHNITPRSIEKKLFNIMESVYEKDYVTVSINKTNNKDLKKHKKTLYNSMIKAAENLEFEKAARLRDKLNEVEKKLLDIN